MRRTEENEPKELLSDQKTTNLAYAAEQATAENARISPYNTDDTRVENTQIDITDGKAVYISIGQGGRDYQQDRFDAKIVEAIGMLSTEEISRLLYDTGVHFGEKYADVFGHGSTANVVVYANNTLITMNIGDSRSVLLGQEAIQLSFDHKPSFEPEAKRVQSEGGIINNGKFVKIDQEKKDNKGRFFRNMERRGIAITRSIGNSAYYPGKSHIPSMTEVPTPTTSDGSDLLLVIGSDGLWDYVSENNLLEFKKSGLTPPKIAHEARKLAYLRSPSDHKGAKLADNCTVLVSHLFEYTVYAVFDGHGNSNAIVDSLQEGFIREFQQRAHQYLIGIGKVLPDPPEDNYSTTQSFSSQDWDALPSQPNSPEPEIINDDESASASAPQLQPHSTATNEFKLENQHKRPSNRKNKREKKRMRIDSDDESGSELSNR